MAEPLRAMRDPAETIAARKIAAEAAGRNPSVEKPPSKARTVVGDIFALIAMATISLAVATGLIVEFGMGLISAGLIATSLFFVLLVVHAQIRRARHVQSRMNAMSHEFESNKRQLLEIRDTLNQFQSSAGLLQGVQEVEAKLGGKSLAQLLSMYDSSDEKLKAQIAILEQQILALKDEMSREHHSLRDTFGSEINVLETLIKQVTENMADNRAVTSSAAADLDSHTIGIELPGQSNPAAGINPTASSDIDAQAQARLAADANAILSAFSKFENRQDLLDTVRKSIESNKIDLYMQPIVALPDRSVRYYEVLTRLRTEMDETVLPTNYIPVAEEAGMMPLIDNVMLFRSVQVVSRLAQRGSTRALFCNISPHSLLDPDFFPEFIAFMEQNTSLADKLIFEFSQSIVKQFGAIELESLATLTKNGFRFSLDKVEKLDLDFAGLHANGFRFLKVDAAILLEGMEEAGSPIHAADFSHYLHRNGLELIVEKIEDEATLTRLHPYKIALGQGFLFSEPKPVRPEIYGQPRIANRSERAA